MSEKHLIINEPSSAIVTAYSEDGLGKSIEVNDLSVKAWDEGQNPLIQIMAERNNVEVQIDLSIEDAKTLREWLDKAIFDAVKIENKIEDEQRKAAKKEGGAK